MIFCLPKPEVLSIKSRSSRHGEVSELVEGARLEIVCTLKAYQEFESLPLRHRENDPLGNQRVFLFLAPVPFLSAPPPRAGCRSARLRPDLPRPPKPGRHPFAIPDDICHIFFFHTGRDGTACPTAGAAAPYRPHLHQSRKMSCAPPDIQPPPSPLPARTKNRPGCSTCRTTS